MVGAVVAGLLLHLRDSAQRKYSRQAERRALVVKKYEQLHQELSDLDSAIGLIAVDLIGVAGLGDKIDLGTYSSKIRLSSALMHAEFYAPEVLPLVASLQPKLAQFYQVIFKLGANRSKATSERMAMAESALEISNQVKEVVRAAHQELTKIASEVIHGA